jgi:hypothetical protein
MCFDYWTQYKAYLLNPSEQRIKFHSETLIRGAGVAHQHYESFCANLIFPHAGWGWLRIARR